MKILLSPWCAALRSKGNLIPGALSGIIIIINRSVCVCGGFFCHGSPTLTPEVPSTCDCSVPNKLANSKIQSLFIVTSPPLQKNNYIPAKWQRFTQSASKKIYISTKQLKKPSTRKRPWKNLPLQLQNPKRFGNGIPGFRALKTGQVGEQWINLSLFFPQRDVFFSQVFFV